MRALKFRARCRLVASRATAPRAVPALFEREKDSTLAAWYSCFYAPRTGGAYDSHHRTAEVAGRTRRRGGRVAARGARAAASSAGDRISPLSVRGSVERAQLTSFGLWG